MRYLRDVSVLQVAPGRSGLVDATEEELAELTATAGELDRSRVTQMFERMLRCCDELGKTLQPRLVLDCALIDVATIEPLVPLGDLLERLAELEHRLAGRPTRPGGGGGGAKDRPRTGPPPSSRPPASPVRTESPAAPAPAAMPAPGAGTGRGSGAVRSPGGGNAAGSAGSTGSIGEAQEARDASPARVADPVVPAAIAARAAGGTSPPEAARDVRVAADAAAPVASAAPGSVSLQPSGPVPRPETIASGSGPHDHAAPAAPPAPGEPAAPAARAAPAEAAGPTRPAGPTESAAAAEPAAPRLAIPASPAEALRAWNTVLEELEALRKFSLLGPFQHARVMTWTPELLELGFPVDVHSMGDMAKDSVEELRAILRTLGPAQKSVRVIVRLLDEGESKTTGARSILETTRERTSAERSRREAEARAHPITKHVLQTFGAQIKEIKTDV